MVEKVAVRGGLRRSVDLAAAERRNAREAMSDIKGIGNLAEFAIADAVDAGRHLLLDDFTHSPCEIGVKRRLFEGPAGFARLQELQQIGGPRQAPDMRGEDPLGARLHPPGLPVTAGSASLSQRRSASCRSYDSICCRDR